MKTTQSKRRKWLSNLCDGLLEEVDLRMHTEEPPGPGWGQDRLDQHEFLELMRSTFRQYIKAAARNLRKTLWPCGCGLVDDQPVFCASHAKSLRKMERRCL